ncbi:Uu.00g031320.m01.CDS01 [Anthostomella pinea]|uniref:Uu.00g031320.m01.CDS01 n=1 Tax=Anthostomella pinea TaxID=933095 RepID=A0AAI8YAN4_9PEZI|nr:Uu.00g031320.m01.CDS01 [Anthostomella pinea]
MCGLTRLFCVVCTANDLYLFHRCNGIEDDKYYDPKGDKPLPPGHRFYCPEMTWPLAPSPQDMSLHVCDVCLRRAIIWYNNISEAKKINDDARREHSRYPRPAIAASEETDDDEMEFADTDFPPDWKYVSQSIKRMVYHKHCKNKIANADAHWETRLSELSHRSLTLWVPCCNLCKTPTFTPNGGIEGIEMEPSSVFWKWMCQLKNENVVQMQIATGFLTKPCIRCAKAELALRRKVTQLVETDGSRFEAWAVWIWLSMRGSYDVDFWKHESINVGIPECPTPPAEDFMKLMTVGWRTRTGTIWEDLVDLEAPATCSFLSLMHKTPFNALSQWTNFAGKPCDAAAPEVQAPPSPMATRESTPTGPDALESEPGLQSPASSATIDYEEPVVIRDDDSDNITEASTGPREGDNETAYDKEQRKTRDAGLLTPVYVAAMIPQEYNRYVSKMKHQCQPVPDPHGSEAQVHMVVVQGMYVDEDGRAARWVKNRLARDGTAMRHGRYIHSTCQNRRKRRRGASSDSGPPAKRVHWEEAPTPPRSVRQDSRDGLLPKDDTAMPDQQRSGRATPSREKAQAGRMNGSVEPMESLEGTAGDNHHLAGNKQSAQQTNRQPLPTFEKAGNGDYLSGDQGSAQYHNRPSSPAFEDIGDEDDLFGDKEFARYEEVQAQTDASSGQEEEDVVMEDVLVNENDEGTFNICSAKCYHLQGNIKPSSMWSLEFGVDRIEPIQGVEE